MIMIVASSQFTKSEKDAMVAALEAVTVAANLAYEPIKAFNNSVGNSGVSDFHSAGNGLESALDRFLKSTGDAKL